MMISAIWHGYYFGYYIFFFGLASLNEIAKRGFRSRNHPIFDKIKSIIGLKPYKLLKWFFTK